MKADHQTQYILKITNIPKFKILNILKKKKAAKVIDSIMHCVDFDLNDKTSKNKNNSLNSFLKKFKKANSLKIFEDLFEEGIYLEEPIISSKKYSISKKYQQQLISHNWIKTNQLLKDLGFKRKIANDQKMEVYYLNGHKYKLISTPNGRSYLEIQAPSQQEALNLSQIFLS